MIGIIFIIGITYGVGYYLVHLVSIGKVTLIDGKIVFVDKEEVREKALKARKKYFDKDKFYATKLVRRNPNRRKGEVRKKV